MKKFYYLIIVFVCVMFGLYLSSCNSNKISTPTNIHIDEDNNLIWDKNKEARGYEIKILDVDENTEQIAQTRKLYYSLDILEEGDYEISVSAISGTSAKNSDFSEIMYFHKYYETGCVYTLINNNSEYAITKVGKASGTFVIEDYYRNKAVTQIADAAFKGSTKVEGITIGSNVESIGENSFYNCSKLNNIIIPESVRTIGVAAFQNCKALKKITIPSSITSLQKYTFGYCRALEEVNLPNTLEEIGESCFQDCSALKQILIPNSVKSISNDVFAACTALETVEIGSGVEEIGNNVFISCSALVNIRFSNEGNLKTLGTSTFADCTSLDSVTLPDGLETIGNTCFSGDTALTNISIPDSVNKLGARAFGKTKLYQDQYNSDSLLFYADKWVIGYNMNKSQELQSITASKFKAGTIGIADEVFGGNSDIQTVTTPTTLKYIGDKAFANCVNLWKFTTSENSLKTIGDYAFTNCGLTNVSFGPGLQEIGAYAFMNNTQLDNNNLSPNSWIPDTVTSIGAYAFYNTLLWTNPRDGGDIIYAANWVVGYVDGAKLGSITLEFDTTRVSGIADFAFMDCGSLTSISGLSNCRYIGKGAFYGCVSLSNVSLNRNLTEIRDYTFYKCWDLIKVTFPRTLKSIGEYAFYSCQYLESVELESTDILSIGKGAFRDCSNLQVVSFNDEITKIGELAFYNCVYLGSINIPDSVNYLGKKSFYNCTSLQELTIGNGIEVINESTFYNCTSLQSIIIPSSVKTIGKKAFYKCSNAKTLKLGENVEAILDYAFYDNKAVEKLEFNDNLKSIGNYAFKGLEKISVVKLPKTITSIGQHAFYGLKSATFYTDATELLPNWHARLNSSRRPMFYGVTFDEEGKITSVVVSKDLLINKNASGGISAPADNFSGWRDDENNIYSMEEVIALELEEALKLYAIYE